MTAGVSDSTSDVALRKHTHAGWLTLASVAAGAGNYFFAVLLTHRLSAAQYSIFAASQTLLLLNGLIGAAGIPWVMAREISQAGDDQERIRNAITFGFWGNIISGLLVAGGTAGIAAFFAPVSVVAIVFVSAFLLAIGSTGAAVLQGEERTGWLAVIVANEVALKLIVGVALVSVWHTAAAALIGSLAGVISLYAGFIRVWGRVGKPRGLRRQTALWRSALRLGRLQVGVGVVSSIDTVAVAILPVAHVAAATYQAAAALGRVPVFVSNAISTAGYPALVRPERATSTRAQSLSSYFLIGAIVVVALVTMPRAVLLLFFPHSFAGLSTYLPLTATLGVGLGALNLCMTFAQSRANTRPSGWTLLATILLALGGAVLGHHLDGVKGLALALDLVCWLAFAAVEAEPEERPALIPGLRQLLSWRLIPLVLASVGLSLVQATVPWLIVAIVAGIATLAVAFPELVGGGRVSAPQPT